MIPFLNLIACVFGIALKCLTSTYFIASSVFSCLRGAWPRVVPRSNVKKLTHLTSKQLHHWTFYLCTSLCTLLSTAGTLFADTALDFDGVDDFLELPTSAGSPLDFGTSAFTIAMWIKATRTGSEQRLVTARRGFTGDDQDGYTISITPTGALEFFVSLGDDRTNTITENNVADGTWKHIALSRGVSGSNSVSIDIAVNGRGVIGSSRGYTGSSDKDLDIRQSTYIGADYNPRPGSGHGKWFSGQIDELRIWNISRDGSSDYDDALAQAGLPLLPVAVACECGAGVVHQ